MHFSCYGKFKQIVRLFKSSSSHSLLLLILPHQTLDLLCRITNASNVETVSSKLIGYLRGTVDSYFRAELVARITELAERYPLCGFA